MHSPEAGFRAKLEEMVGRGFTPAQAAGFLYDCAVTLCRTARPVTLH